MKALQFSTVLKEQPVTLTGADGQPQEYIIKELNGTQRATYNSSFDMKVELKDGKAQAVSGQNFKPFPATKFLAMCFFKKADDGTLISMTETQVGLLPGKVVEDIYQAALKLSGLSGDIEEDAKND